MLYYTQPNLWMEVVVCLRSAGFIQGSYHTGSGWSDYGDLEYTPPRLGFVVRTEETAVIVDHSGKGRKVLLPRYQEALEAQGFVCGISKRCDWHTKQVLFVGVVGQSCPVDMNDPAEWKVGG